VPDDGSPCACTNRPSWARLEDEAVLHWPVIEVGEWEELRQCSECGRHWLTTWPEELDGGPILCRPIPGDSRRLRDVDRMSTLRRYCLARLEEHLGQLREEKRPCKKMGCEGKRLMGTSYCLEHMIAQRSGRQLSKLERRDSL
jgi:hypothetical protein